MDRMENNHENETSKNQTLHPEATWNETNKNDNLHPEATGNETSKSQSLHPEATCNNENPFIQDKLLDHSASFSSSSSSSSSSSMDPFEIESHEKDPLKISLTKVEDGSPMSPLDNSTHTPQWSMISASPRGGGSAGLDLSSPEVLNQDWAAVNASPKQSPPVQVMGRPAGYDPKRIPSSVFSTKPTTPMEWSVASNESLFSIHMGNSSFSRDHSILLGKSGELNRMDDWTNSPYLANESKSSDLNNLSSGLPTVIEAAGENGGKTGSIDMESGEKEDFFEHGKGTEGDEEKKMLSAPEEVNKSASDGKGTSPAEAACTSASTPRLSDESGNSASSFAFPVYGGEGGSSKACPDKPASQKENPSLEPEDSGKKEPPEPQSPLDTPKAAVGGTRWFSCFTCCPLFC